MKATNPSTVPLRSLRPVRTDSAGSIPTGGTGYFHSAPFLKTLQHLSRLRLAWLHHRHPEWKLTDIIRDMKKWFDKDLPTEVIAQVLSSVKSEWRKKTFLDIETTQLDRLFDRKPIG